jgi:hypothetical protein
MQSWKKNSDYKRFLGLDYPSLQLNAWQRKTGYLVRKKYISRDAMLRGSIANHWWTLWGFCGNPSSIFRG